MCSLGLAVGALAQGRLDKLSFSLLDGEQPVHVAQVAFQNNGNRAIVVSTVGFTQRSGPLRLEPGAPLRRTLFLGNASPRPQTFTALALVDDLQRELGLDGQSAPVHALTVEADAQKRWDLTLSAPSERGLHNLLLLVFYAYTGDQGSSEGLFTPYADSLVIGVEEVPPTSVARPEDEAFLEGRPVGVSTALPPAGISLSRTEKPSSESELLDSPLRLRAGETFTGFLHVRNGLPRRGDVDEFALVLLWDGRQIPVDVEASGPVAHFTLPLRGLADVPLRLAVPEAPGDHTLDVLAIRNPYRLQAGRDAMEVLHRRYAVEVN